MMRLRCRATRVTTDAALLIGAITALGATFAHTLVSRLPESRGLDFEAVHVRIVPIRSDIYMLVSHSHDVFAGNIVAQTGADGVLLVDSQYEQLAAQNLAALRTLTHAPVRYVVNTHMHIDHVGGNGALSTDAGTGSRATIVAHENVARRLARPAPAGRKPALWPTQTYAAPASELVFNGELVRIVHVPTAHTDGDSFVHFTGSRVVSAGDVYNGTMYPIIDRANGGSLRGLLAGLDVLLALAAEPDTLIIPGHGDPARVADVAAYKEMLVAVRDRTKEMIAAGMSLRQVQRARPTAEYDHRWAAEHDFWTTDQFVAAVYLELAGG